MKKLTLLSGVAALTLVTVAFADGHTDVDPAIKARQAHMQLYAHNLGILGAMAQEKVAYNAEAAQTAADNLVLMSSVNESTYWVEGTFSDSTEEARALPAIGENMDDFALKQQGMTEAATNMADLAGTDLATLQSGMRDLGGACSACHREYRERDE